MGQVSTEQAIQIFNAGTEAVNTLSQPDPVINIIQPDPNYWWLALIAVLPVIAGGIHFGRKRKKK
jgi:hypothetical protein